MIHIEFAGIPGSGKSFLCSSIETILRSRSIPVVTSPHAQAEKKLFFRILGKSGTVVPQILKHPLWTMRILCIINRSRQKSIRGGLRSFFTITQICGMVNRYRKKDICLLLDQGSVQAFFSLLYEADKQSPLKLESLIPKPDILLETDGKTSVLLSRLAARSQKQSRIESDGIRGIEYSRSIFKTIHKTKFYNSIPSKICIPDERTDNVIQAIARQILEKISHDQP